jgi:hypothetical protein
MTIKKYGLTIKVNGVVKTERYSSRDVAIADARVIANASKDSVLALYERDGKRDTLVGEYEGDVYRGRGFETLAERFGN